MKFVAFFLLMSLGWGLAAFGRMGDSLEETIFRYGQPVARTGQPGALTSTQTFSKDGLTIVCGYVNKVVEMYSVTRNDRAFIPPEVEAVLRTNGRHQNWTPGQPFGPGTYHRSDGITATVSGAQIVITSPKWLAALARDKATADQAAAAKSAGNTTTTNEASESVATP